MAGRKGYLRGQLMRDQDTGEYLVQALGGAPGASSHLLATLAEANCLVVIPSDAEEIRTGELSMRLLRPIHPFIALAIQNALRMACETIGHGLNPHIIEQVQRYHEQQ